MNLEEKTIGNISGNFIIEAYQRGYRWGKDEIERLLEDIQEIPDGQKYCLQPVVVKDTGGATYELIDGQQRMTTLYLIMKHLSNYIDIQYTIEYVTRKNENGHIGSRELLEKIDTINILSESRDIDELFIKNAYGFIKTWFDGDKKKMMSFARKLQEYVTVIWYEVDVSEDSVSIFTRLNIGKISLTNAELVKALFLSKGNKRADGLYAGNPYGIEEKNQHEIALKWDSMEKELHNEMFWAFITNESPKKYPIRMELLFDMIEKKSSYDNGDFYTFNCFYKRFKNSKNKYVTWELIERYMQQLKEWYNDFNLFHYIGFLVATGTNVKELLDIAMSEENPIRKSEFLAVTLDKIRKHMVFTTGANNAKEEIDYEELDYNKHPKEIKDLLLLFNVETIRQKGDENNRFPFNRYKSGTWSLEHIHAQNSENLKTNQEWREWLVLHKKSLEELEPNQEINRVIPLIEKVIAHIDDKSYRGSIRDEFTTVSTAVIDILSDNNDKSQMHTLSNMTLLTVEENAALSNSTFDVKRKKIIEMDKNGEYIPICTKNIFMKYYSSSDTKLHFWSEADRIGYINAINNTLYGKTDADEKNIKLIKERIRYGTKQ